MLRAPLRRSPTGPLLKNKETHHFTADKVIIAKLLAISTETKNFDQQEL